MKEIGKHLQQENAIPNALALIQEFCWIFLETDLREIRTELEKLRTEELILDPGGILASRAGTDRRMVVETCRELNECVNRKFGTLCNWLTKPNNISPSAPLKLLISAVMNEVAEQYENFSPDLQINAPDIDLYGHRYHCIYDILEVFVANAAKHGSAEAPLVFNASLEQAEGGRSAHCHISLLSEITDQKDMDKYRSKIETKMNANIDDALRIEGESGIRKVRSIISNYEELSSLSVHFHKKKIEFRFKLELSLS